LVINAGNPYEDTHCAKTYVAASLQISPDEWRKQPRRPLWKKKEAKRDLQRDGHNAKMAIPQNTHPRTKNRFVKIPLPQWHYDCRCSRSFKTSKL
jgi:hypothetical protein